MIRSVIFIAAIGTATLGAAMTAGALERLPPTEVEYIFDTYPVTRTASVRNGVTTEHWKVRYNHVFVPCPRPTQDSCVGALQDYDHRQTRDRGS